MTIRNLGQIFTPRSVAIIGASEKPDFVGRVVLANTVNSGFEGKIYPVNPKYRKVQGLTCYRRIADLPEAPDLAVIMTPPKTVPGILRELGKKGGPAAAVLTAGLTRDNGLREEMLEAAGETGMRVVGPNTLGAISPLKGINFSFSHMAPGPGHLALLSQSGAIATSLIDWAVDQGVGFSHVLSLGDMADVDMADCLDYLALDGKTRAILLYIESVPEPRKFISAARAASRLKPVIAIKPGRSEAAARAAATHTGALSGNDAAFDAALARAGILRVKTLGELFDAAETVSRFPALQQARVAIITNGGGAGVLTVDSLMELGGELAELAPETIAALDEVLPPTWSHANPVDIIGDASAERYENALRIVSGDENVDAVLVMNCPTALASPVAAATAIGELVEHDQVHGKPVLTCWLGEHAARPARIILQGHGLANYDTPSDAARAVAFLSRWNKAQKSLLRVPADHRTSDRYDSAKAKEIFATVSAEGRDMLTEPEAKAVLAAYGVPVPQLIVAKDPEGVEKAATELLKSCDAVVVKLVSRTISHKSDVGGVALSRHSAASARRAADAMVEKVAALMPDAEIDGFAVQPMVRTRKAHETIVGMSRDPVFGPVMLFGAGGTAVEVVRDTAIGLPPLDAVLAEDMIDHTRISRLLAGYRDEPAADREAIIGAILATTQLVVDFPGITGIDINPLVAGPDGVIALDARIAIDPQTISEVGTGRHLAIRPYPAGWDKTVKADTGAQFHIRPVLPADAHYLPEFFAGITPEDMRLRYLTPHKMFSREALRRLTQIDYDREMAFVAVSSADQMGGIARVSIASSREEAEFSILVRSDLQGHGLGRALFEHLIDFARADGIETLEGLILSENTKMLALCREFGFRLHRPPDEPGLIQANLDLRISG